MQGSAAVENPLKQHTAQFMANRDNLLAFIGALVRRPEIVEDIFQDVWVRLADACEKGVAIGDTRSWCRGTARNLILKHWREQRTSRVIADERILDLADKAFGEDDRAGSPWTRKGPLLVACVQELPEHSRNLLRWRFLDGLSAVQIAGRIGQSYEAVRKAIFRVKKSLEECVELKNGRRPAHDPS